MRWDSWKCEWIIWGIWNLVGDFAAIWKHLVGCLVVISCIYEFKDFIVRRMFTGFGPSV